MKTKEPNYDIMPAHYLSCFNDECTLADHCLRRLAARSRLQTGNIVQAVNPAQHSGENCPYYKENKETTMAYGMKDSFHEIKADDIAELRNTLINHFGRTYYYRRRNGLRPITPEEQQYISNVFRRFGYKATFDKLVKETQWL